MGWGGKYQTFTMTGASVSTHLLASLAKLPMASPLLQEPGTGDWGGKFEAEIRGDGAEKGGEAAWKEEGGGPK